MSSTLSKVFIFAAGALVGSAVTWKIVKTKYEKIAQEEIDSVKEVFSKRVEHFKKAEEAAVATVNVVNVQEAADEAREKPNLQDYAKRLIEQGYTSYADLKNPGKGGSDTVKKPYVITPEEFGNSDDYDTITLTYYEADQILADDMDEIVEDVDDVVGKESLTHFGENADDPDSVYVRNDEMKADYEILIDTRRYVDVTGKTNLTENK